MRSFAEPVLVLDAHLRHSLAVVRSLSRAGVGIVALSHTTNHPVRWSGSRAKCVALDLQAPDALPRIVEILHSEGIGAVIPSALLGNEFLCRHRETLEPIVKAPYNDLEQFEILSQKDRTIALAQELGVPCPRSFSYHGPDSLPEILASLEFPVVFKSTVDQGTVRYAHNADELKRIGEEFVADNASLMAQGLYPVVQEYIEGDGHGFYGLGVDGDVRCYFMHKRMHEVPPSGGPSAMAMSWYDDDLMELGLRFFKATRWNGPAMVEFKKSRRDGRYYLIEVNPKFWGSLALGVAAGVDFPRHLLEILSGADVSTRPGDYRRDFVYRWLTMDLAHSVQARAIPRFLGDFFRPSVHDDFEWRDPLPSLVLFLQGVRRFF